MPIYHVWKILCLTLSVDVADTLSALTILRASLNLMSLSDVKCWTFFKKPFRATLVEGSAVETHSLMTATVTVVADMTINGTGFPSSTGIFILINFFYI